MLTIVYFFYITLSIHIAQKVTPPPVEFCAIFTNLCLGGFFIYKNDTKSVAINYNAFL